MKMPLILAHGTELLAFYIAAIVLGHLLASVACWLAFKRKKMAALIISAPAIALGALLASGVHLFIGWLPLILSVCGFLGALVTSKNSSEEKS